MFPKFLGGTASPSPVSYWSMISYQETPMCSFFKDSLLRNFNIQAAVEDLQLDETLLGHFLVCLFALVVV